MKTAVLITAVAGSGKSTVCMALQNLSYDAHDLESVPGLYRLVDEKTGETLPGRLEQIREGVDWRCDKAKLQALVDASSEGLAFYCGGMSNTEEVWDVFDKVIVLTVGDVTTIERLSARRPGEFGGTKTNRDWVMSWKHDFEQRLLQAGGIPVSAEGAPAEVAKSVIKAATP